jgi:hypothetical protein
VDAMNEQTFEDYWMTLKKEEAIGSKELFDYLVSTGAAKYVEPDKNSSEMFPLRHHFSAEQTKDLAKLFWQFAKEFSDSFSKKFNRVINIKFSNLGEYLLLEFLNLCNWPFPYGKRILPGPTFMVMQEVFQKGLIILEIPGNPWKELETNHTIKNDNTFDAFKSAWKMCFDKGVENIITLSEAKLSHVNVPEDYCGIWVEFSTTFGNLKDVEMNRYYDLRVANHLLHI